MRSGYFDIANDAGVLRGGAFGSNSQSSRGNSDATIFYLTFSDIVYTSFSSFRRFAFPLRCLSTVLDYVEAIRIFPVVPPQSQQPEQG